MSALLIALIAAPTVHACEMMRRYPQREEFRTACLDNIDAQCAILEEAAKRAGLTSGRLVYHFDDKDNATIECPLGRSD